jgi:hypothetical protein
MILLGVRIGLMEKNQIKEIFIELNRRKNCGETRVVGVKILEVRKFNPGGD